MVKPSKVAIISQHLSKYAFKDNLMFAASKAF
jgi:hypothetical protein